jgi:ABC-type lipoprotein export system ATPase subunit
VVTHDDTMARAARRVVHMRDGRVERDERGAGGAAP